MMLGLMGVTAIDCSKAEVVVTVIVVLPLIPPRVAVIVEFPPYRGRQAGWGNGGHRGEGRGPGHLAGKRD
jgi:hypothetical protein